MDKFTKQLEVDLKNLESEIKSLKSHLCEVNNTLGLVEKYYLYTKATVELQKLHCSNENSNGKN